MTQASSSPQSIIDKASAFYDSCVLFTASDLGVFVYLAEHPDSDVARLADALALNQRGATLLLDACVALDLLTKTDGRYLNTDAAQAFLVPGAPGDLSGAIRYNRDVYAAWGKLAEFTRQGKPVEAPEIHLGQDAERTRTFVLSMHYRALGIGRAVVPMLNLADCETLLDVGGGPGTYSALIAQANPNLRCTVLDLPDVASIANELIAQQGLSDRVSTLPGNYRTTEFPPSQDVVHFFGVLHQESPESILSLFKKAFASLKPGGRIHVMDLMTDATHTSPKFSALFAVNMALTTENGWVFSDDELVRWLGDAGFIDMAVQSLPAPMPHWIVAARKPE